MLRNINVPYYYYYVHNLFVICVQNGGRLKLSKQGVFFKSIKTGKVEQVHVEDLAETNWLRVARGHELKLRLQNGSIFKYDGFQESVSWYIYG